jgi:hypothetical protein
LTDLAWRDFGASMWTRVLALFALSSAALADPPSLEAKVEEPVLEELMGGCSLKCAFDWTGAVSLPGLTKRESVRVLDDDTALTAWSASDAKVGAGVKFHLLFPKKLPKGMSGTTPIYGFDLVNGFWKSEELWEAHARVKRARLYYNDKPLHDLTYADTRRWQRVELPDIMVRDGDSMTFEILEVYPGKSAGLAITEIVLQGAH